MYYLRCLQFQTDLKNRLRVVAGGDFCGLCFWNNNVALYSLASIPPTFSSLFIFLHSYLTKNTISFTGRPSRPLCRIALGRWSRLSPFAMACPLYSLFCQKLYFITLTVNYLAGALASPWTRHPHFTRSPSKCVCDVSPCCNPCAPPCFPACFSVLYSYITNSNVGRLRHVPCFLNTRCAFDGQSPPSTATIRRHHPEGSWDFSHAISRTFQRPPYILAPVSWFLSECVICG